MTTKAIRFGTPVAFALLVASCGGGSDTVTPPPTGQNPPPAVATTDFNLFTASLVTQGTNMTDGAEPLSLDNYVFTYVDDREGVFDSTLPP